MSTSNNHYLIDQQIEATSSFLVTKQNQKNKNTLSIEQQIKAFNTKKSLHEKGAGTKLNFVNQGSYQVILQQSLTTQDKQFLHEILSEDEHVIIKNSINDLSAKKVIDLLKMIKVLLENNVKYGKGKDNCLSITKWLEQLLKVHLSVIVSNIQNKQIIVSIKKLLNKRIQKRAILIQMRQRLLETDLKSNKVENKVYYPKFDYVQEQRVQIQEQQNQDLQGMDENMMQDGEQFMDEQMADFYQDDF